MSRNNDRDRPNASSRRRPSWREGLQEQAERREPSAQPQPPLGVSSDRVGHKWRDMASETGSQGELPPLPGQRPPRKSRKARVGNKAIIFGAVLLAIVVGMLVLPFTPLMDDEPVPTPTAQLAQGITPTAEVPANATEAPTHAPAETVESDFMVCIDPGHGGWDYGRERMDQGVFAPPWFFESEITLSMSYFLRDELESRGIAVVMTRETGGAVNWRNDDVNGDGQVMDTSPQGLIAGMRDETQARINICNEANADIMLSIHLNGFDDQSVGGYEIYYNSQREFAQQNRDLAGFLYREMSVAFADLGYDAAARGTKDDLELSADTHEFGAEQFLLMIGPEVVKPEYTIKPTNMPGVVIETLFVTNTNDANFILNPANQQRLAVGWADGIENYRQQYGDESP